MKKIIQSLVIRSNKYSLCYNLNKSIYSYALRVCVNSLNKLPFVISIYLRRSMLDKRIEPGSSDIDLAIIFKDLSLKKEVFFMKQFLKKYRQLKTIFPFLGEIVFLNKTELKLWLRHGGSHAYEAVNTWKLMNGTEVLPEKIKNDLKNEFSRAITWYLHYLLLAYLNNDLNKTYLRTVFNSCENILRHLNNSGFNKNEFEIEEKLSLIKKNNYFSKKGEKITNMLLVELLDVIEQNSKKVLRYFRKRKLSEPNSILLKQEESKAKAILKDFIADIRIGLGDYVKEVFFSSAGFTKYNYCVDIILKSDLTKEDSLYFFKKLKIIYRKHKDAFSSKYVDKFKPLQILKENSFKFNLIYPHGWPSQEIFYLKDKFESWKPYFDESGLKADLSFFPAYHRMLIQSSKKKISLIFEDLFIGYMNSSFRYNKYCSYFEKYPPLYRFYNSARKEL